MQLSASTLAAREKSLRKSQHGSACVGDGARAECDAHWESGTSVSPAPDGILHAEATLIREVG
jgi:hypothetical protein